MLHEVKAYVEKRSIVNLQWNLKGHRIRRRPQMTWKRSTAKETELTIHTWKVLIKIAQGREKWKAVISGLRPAKDGRL